MISASFNLNPYKDDCTGGRFLSKLHHLPQAHTSRWKSRVVLDGLHQLLGLFPRHLEIC